MISLKDINQDKDFDLFDFGEMSNPEEESKRLKAFREGTFEQGKKTGFPNLDQYFRFKENSFVMINGHDNVGKSFVVWYLAVLSNLMHHWKWIFLCRENKASTIRKSLIEFKYQKPLRELSEDEYSYGLDWAFNNFFIFKNNQELKYKKILDVASKAVKIWGCKSFLVDPYNSLELDTQSKLMKFGTHDYHYQVANDFRTWINENQCSIWVNAHAVTEALRRRHTEGDPLCKKQPDLLGHPMPPGKADTEGGGKWANRADDFLTIHRYTQHESRFMETNIYVRKIKETETGGRPSPFDEPVILRLGRNKTYFQDPEGRIPFCNNPELESHYGVAPY